MTTPSTPSTATAETPSAGAATRTTTYVWAILCAITILSWWLAPGHAGSAAVASAPITFAVVLLGFIKGRLIIGYFMEIRSAPRWLKVATDAWLVILWTAILVIYLV